MIQYQADRTAFFTDFGTTGVILDARKGFYFGLDIVGTEIWRAIQLHPRTIDELVAEVLGKFEDASINQVRGDIEGFLSNLTRVVRDGATQTAIVADCRRAGAPNFMKPGLVQRPVLRTPIAIPSGEFGHGADLHQIG